MWVEAMTQDATVDLAKPNSIETVGPGWYVNGEASDDYVLIAAFGDRGTWFSLARGSHDDCEAERARLAGLLKAAGHQ